MPTNAKPTKDPVEVDARDDLDQDIAADEAELDRSATRLASDETDEEELAEEDILEMFDVARYDEGPDA